MATSMANLTGSLGGRGLPPRTPNSAAHQRPSTLNSSASLPAIPPAHQISKEMQSLSKDLQSLSASLSTHGPKTRQRIFAAHAHDTQQLQQMIAVLTHRASKPAGRDRGIANAGLIEEGQLYAVCMQELAAQMAVHSPALSELSGQLFHGFVNLFQRSVSAQEARLARERDAHEGTRVQFRVAETDAEHWRTLKEEMERKIKENSLPDKSVPGINSF